VIHAGDYCVSINTMKKYFNYFVDGNNDYDWKDKEIFTYAGFKFLLLHGDCFWSWNENRWHQHLRALGKEHEVDIVIFGHSHRDLIDTTAKPYLLNPGSISLPRNKGLQKSYALIEISDKNIDFQIKYVKN
jgi:putative phosphoesterase